MLSSYPTGPHKTVFAFYLYVLYNKERKYLLIDLATQTAIWNPYHVNKGNHPNKVDFEGILAILDKPSGNAVSGTDDHQLILPSNVAFAALDSLIGMGVNHSLNWQHHSYTRKCALITKAWLEKNKLMVGGFIYASHYPKVPVEIKTGRVGMSYEICDWEYEEVTKKVWKITRAVFSGAAFLHKMAAAYRGTKVKLT